MLCGQGKSESLSCVVYLDSKLMHVLNRQKGFTLIELLVVIAIIGILSSVVLASLNTARGKGANAAVKANISNLRAAAEIYYDSTGNGSYGSVGLSSPTDCITTTQPMFNDPSIEKFTVAAQKAGGGTTRCIAQPTGGPATSYVVSVQLKQLEGTNNYWCVDSSGNSKGHPNVLSGSITSCP